jgi:hypothetical protein
MAFIYMTPSQTRTAASYIFSAPEPETMLKLLGANSLSRVFFGGTVEYNTTDGVKNSTVRDYLNTKVHYHSYIVHID